MYSFTSSNQPTVGQVSTITILLNNTFTGNSASLSFPTTWINVGIYPPVWTSSGSYWPSSLLAGKIAIISLTAYDTSTVMGTYAVQS